MAQLAVRVQEKGQVTIPRELRQQLKLKKGDFVTFILTDKGLLVQPVEVVITAALDKIGTQLRGQGVTFEDLMESGERIRAEIAREKYGLGTSRPKKTP